MVIEEAETEAASWHTSTRIHCIAYYSHTGLDNFTPTQHTHTHTISNPSSQCALQSGTLKHLAL